MYFSVVLLTSLYYFTINTKHISTISHIAVSNKKLNVCILFLRPIYHRNEKFKCVQCLKITVDSLCRIHKLQNTLILSIIIIAIYFPLLLLAWKPLVQASSCDSFWVTGDSFLVSHIHAFAKKRYWSHFVLQYFLLLQYLLIK